VGGRRLVSAMAAVVLGLGLAVGVGAPAPADQDVVVSATPEAKHPRILDGRVYSIASSGPEVLVGGSFTTVRNSAPGSPDIDQPRLFRFDSDTGAIDESFRPQIDGDVEAVTYTGDGQSILIAGDFTTVDGQPAERLARLELDGSLDTSFEAHASRRVKDFALVGGRLIVGGEFGKLNGQEIRGLAALDPATGAVDPSFPLHVSVSRDEFKPYVQELDVSANGRWLVIGGNFQRVGTSERHQVAVIDLWGSSPKVAPWSTDRYRGDCAASYDDTYVRGIDISPDSSFFVVNTTGSYFGYDQMCDSTSRWELPPTSLGGGLQPTWVDHTGGDTFWAVEITESAVYVGGHMRWLNNPRPSPGGNDDGPGSVAREGIAALDPWSGVPLSWNPGKGRGRGAEALHATDDYLMVGSDTTIFAGQLRQRLAMLPVAGGTVNPAPEDVPLPVNFFYTTSGSDLNRMAFDGSTFGSISTVSGPAQDGVNWSGSRDGFVQHDRLNYFGPSQAFYSRSFDGTTVGSSVTNLSTSVGYVDSNADLTPYDQPYGVAQTRTAAFKGGRVFYTKSGLSKLFYRGHSLQSGILGGFESVASTNDWSGARSLEFIGNWLYAAWSDNKLYRFWAPDGLPRWGSRAVVDNGATSGIPWSSTKGLWAVGVSGTANPPAPPKQVTVTITRSATESATAEVAATQSVTKTSVVRRTVRLERRYHGRLLRVSATRSVTHEVTRSARRGGRSTATRTRSGTATCTAWSEAEATKCATNRAHERASDAALAAAVTAATDAALAEARDLARTAALRKVRAYIRSQLPEWRQIAYRLALRAAKRKMRAKITALEGG